MSRLPQAFLPLLQGNIQFKSSVQALIPSGQKVTVEYTKVNITGRMFPELTSDNTETAVFDQVIVTCPLGVVRRWKLPGIYIMFD